MHKILVLVTWTEELDVDVGEILLANHDPDQMRQQTGRAGKNRQVGATIGKDGTITHEGPQWTSFQYSRLSSQVRMNNTMR